MQNAHLYCKLWILYSIILQNDFKDSKFETQIIKLIKPLTSLSTCDVHLTIKHKLTNHI